MTNAEVQAYSAVSMIPRILSEIADTLKEIKELLSGLQEKSQDGKKEA